MKETDVHSKRFVFGFAFWLVLAYGFSGVGLGATSVWVASICVLGSIGCLIMVFKYAATMERARKNNEEE